jgi:hypothetical protein
LFGPVLRDKFFVKKKLVDNSRPANGREHQYQMAKNIPNGPKIDQMALK